MARLVFWIAWVWCRLTAVFIIFAAFVFLIVAPLLFHPMAPRSPHPVDYFALNFAKVTGMCGFVAAIWANHYWPRVLAAKQIGSPFRQAWKLRLSGAVLLSSLSLAATVGLFAAFPGEHDQSMSLQDLGQYVLTVSLIGFCYLNFVPIIRRHAPWLLGKEDWLFDRFLLSDSEIAGYESAKGTSGTSFRPRPE